jgi:hypothetical protein
MMTEEQIVIEVEKVEEEAEAPKQRTVTEEFKVQTEDLVDAVKKVAREGTVRRITVLRNDRVLVDIPLAIGAAAGILFAINAPILSAVAGIGALVGGCTLRIERDEPEDES